MSAEEAELRLSRDELYEWHERHAIIETGAPEVGTQRRAELADGHIDVWRAAQKLTSKAAFFRQPALQSK